VLKAVGMDKARQIGLAREVQRLKERVAELEATLAATNERIATLEKKIAAT
jgi:predicted  nucleic acid-binding Zn-ribbon protein